MKLNAALMVAYLILLESFLQKENQFIHLLTLTQVPVICFIVLRART